MNANQSIEFLNSIGLNCHFKYWLVCIRPNETALFHERETEKMRTKMNLFFFVNAIEYQFRILLFGSKRCVCVCVARDDRVPCEDNKSN